MSPLYTPDHSADARAERLIRLTLVLLGLAPLLTLI